MTNAKRRSRTSNPWGEHARVSILVRFAFVVLCVRVLVESQVCLGSELRDELEAVCRESVVGCQIGLLVNGEVETWCFGSADLAATKPIEQTTIFRAGSISKLVTSILALRAEQAGLLELDDPVADFLPQVIVGDQAAQVTLRQLLEHTAGIAGSDFREYATNIRNLSVKDYVDRNAPWPTRWTPSVHFSYSNAGPTIVARAIEIAWGSDFDTLVQREVFQPLAMTHSTFVYSDEVSARSTQSFASRGGPVATSWFVPMRPSGSLQTTATDLMNLVAMLANDGTLPDGSVYLSSRHIDSLHLGQTSFAARQGARSGVYACGNFAFMTGDILTRGHWGKTEGFVTNLGYVPNHRSGFVILSNTANQAAMHRLREILGATLADANVMGSDERKLPPAEASKTNSFDTEPRSGWYAGYSHSMPKRAWLLALLQAKRIAVDANGKRMNVSSFPFLAHDLWQREDDRLFRMNDLPVATGTFGMVDGTTFWIDGESFVRCSPFWYFGQWLIIVMGLFALPCLALVQIFIRALRRMVVRDASMRPMAEHEKRRDAIKRHGLLSSLCGLALMALYVRFDLMNPTAGNDVLGRASAFL